MRRGALGLIVLGVVAIMAIGAQTALAAPVQSLTACLKMEAGQPLGTAVYTLWDNDKARLEIAVAEAIPGEYCVSIDKVPLKVKLTVDEVTKSGSLRLETNWGDFIPPVLEGSKITLKNCDDPTIVICGMFK